MNPRGIAVDRASRVPLQRQLVSALREAIRDGRLEPRERLFSTRELQTHLGVSRNTVVGAFEQLLSEGYLITVRGVGTFVADLSHRSKAQHKHATEQSVESSREATAALTAQGLAENLSATRPFRPGMPALDLFPTAQFKRCFKAGDWHEPVLDYPNPQGHEPLRHAISQRLRQTRGIECEPSQVFITNGAQAAFSLVGRVLLKARDTAVVEDPGYPNVRATLHMQGVRILYARVDDEGIDVASFSRKRARIAYVTPSHQYPSGVILSLDRRLALLEWARRHGSWIVEDDYDSEFDYTGRPQPALYSLSDAGQVIYVGTFSKVLSPALRIAYVVVPPALRAPLRAVQSVSGGNPSLLIQAALARFFSDGYFGRHVTRMRKIYDERRRFVSSVMNRSGAFSVRDTLAGLHFIAELPPGVRDTDVSSRGAAAGLIVPALSSYFQARPKRNALVIGYAATGLAQAKAALDILVNLI